jgi:hypothetical protein
MVMPRGLRRNRRKRRLGGTRSKAIHEHNYYCLCRRPVRLKVLFLFFPR